MKDFSKNDLVLYLFVLNISLCTVTLFLIRQSRAFVLRKKLFSRTDGLSIAVDVIFACQLPLPQSWVLVEPNPKTSTVIAVLTVAPLFLWIKQRERGKSGAFLAVCMLFQRATIAVTLRHKYPLHVSCAIFTMKYLWNSLNHSEPDNAQSIVPHVV